jgi:hypothetical protein
MTGHELVKKWKDSPVGGTGKGRKELRADIDRLVPVGLRPPCLNCGEPLALDVSSIEIHDLDDEVPHRDEQGRLITGRITNVVLVSSFAEIRVDYWTGRLGKDGRGYFHSYRCGFDFASKKVTSKLPRNFEDIEKGGKK